MGRAFEYRKASKLARWDKMAKQFSRIGKEISIAVRAAGPNPESNPALRRCIINARGVNMPKDNIDRAIKKASGADAEHYEEVTYEGYGLGGIAIFLECMTNNTTRTVANVRAIFNKFEGSLGKNGELTFLFDRKGIFVVKDSPKTSLDDFDLEMIDSGAEEIERYEDEVIVTCAFEDFGLINHKFEQLGIIPESSNLQRLPNTTKELSLEQAKVIMKMLEKFEQDDDVQNVYHNMEITKEVQDYCKTI